jgi:hypothetical protein
MNKITVIALCCLFSTLLWAGENRVEVNGLRLVSEGYQGSDKLRPFNHFKGTTLSFVTHVSAGGIIGLDTSASEVHTLQDDTGTDLLSGTKRYGQNTIGGWPKISTDSKAITFEIQSQALPKVEAKAIHIEGHVTLDVSNQTEEHKSGVIDLSNTTNFDIGPISIAIEESGKPKWGNKPFFLKLRVGTSVEKIAKFRFLNLEGVEVDAHRNSTNHLGDEYLASYQLDQKLDQFQIEIELWKNIQKVEIPFNLNASVGL